MNYTKLESIDVLKVGEDYISGEEWLKRAQALTKGTMDDAAFDFYAKEENWHLLPKDVTWLYFPDTEFRDSRGRCFVKCLYCSGAEWRRGCNWLNVRFGRDCRVARLASSSEILEPETNELSYSVLCPNCQQKLTLTIGQFKTKL